SGVGDVIERENGNVVAHADATVLTAVAPNGPVLESHGITSASSSDYECGRDRPCGSERLRGLCPGHTSRSCRLPRGRATQPCGRSARHGWLRRAARCYPLLRRKTARCPP